MHHRPFLAISALVGTLLGGAVAAQAQAQPQSAATYAPAPSTADGAPAPGAMRHRGNRMNRILKTLDLTPQQRATIKGYETSFHAARKTAAPQTRAYLVSEVESALTPVQRQTFETQLHAPRAQDAAAPQGR